MLFSGRTMQVAIAMLGIAITGCGNSRDEYDDFTDRLIDADTRPIDARIISEVPDISGAFYIAARPPLAETRILHFIATQSYTPTSANTGRLDWSTVPLDYDTFEVVAGHTYEQTDLEVRQDGSVDIPLLGVIPGEANSISGSDSDIDATIHLVVISADYLCGTLTGEAGPLNLEGSTFGAQRIDSADSRPLPEPLWNCEMAPPSDAPDAGP